jgi:hypothetical protein
VAHVLRNIVAALLAPLSIVAAAGAAEAAQLSHGSSSPGGSVAWALSEPGGAPPDGAQPDRQEGSTPATAEGETYGITSEALLWGMAAVFGVIALGTLVAGLVAHRRRTARREE